MSCGSLSPSVSTALSGMLNGTGIAPPAAVQSSVSNYTTAGPVATAQTALAASRNVVGNPLNGFGSSILPALTGVVPASLVPNLGDASLNNFPAQITQQSSRLMSGGIGGFAQIFASAQGFTLNSVSIKASVQAGATATFASMGFNLTAANGGSGIISNGLGVRFGNLPNLGTVVGRLNRLYDTRNMHTFGRPDNMVINLLARGYGKGAKLEDKLEEAGVDLDDLSNPIYTSNINAVLSSIQGNELKSIIDECGVTGLPVQAATLRDLTDISRIGTTAEINSLRPTNGTTPSLNDIGKTFSDMGAEFEDATVLGSLVQTIESPVYPRLNQFHEAGGGKLIPPSVKTSIDQNLGTGSIDNFAVAPKIQDLIGSAAGAVHVTSLNDATAALNSIQSDSDVIIFNKQTQLMAKVANGDYGGGGNAIIDGTDEMLMGNVVIIPPGDLSAAGMSGATLGNISTTLLSMRTIAETQLTTISTKPALQTQLNTINSNYEKSAKQLALEKTNLKTAGIDPLQPSPGGPNSNSTGTPYDRSYPTAPLTDWAAEELFRYWQSLPMVFTGNSNIAIKSDACRGAMYSSANLFSNSSSFVSQIDAFLESGALELNANLWTRSIYPDVTSVSFDTSSGMCYFSEAGWRAENLNEERPVGYPITGIPMPSGGEPANVNARSSAVAGDKNSIINLATQLHDIGKDPMGTGVSSLIESMATDDVYGDAVKAALVEGRNMERLTSAGIVPIVNKLSTSTTTAGSYTPPPSYAPAAGTGTGSTPTPVGGIAAFAPHYIPSGMTYVDNLSRAGLPTRLTVDLGTNGVYFKLTIPNNWDHVFAAGWVPTINDPSGGSAAYTVYVTNTTGVILFYMAQRFVSGTISFQPITGTITWLNRLAPGNYTLVMIPSTRAQIYIDIFSQI